MSDSMREKVYAYYEAYYALTPVTNLTEDVETTYEDVPITPEEWTFKKNRLQSMQKRLEGKSCN